MAVRPGSPRARALRLVWLLLMLSLFLVVGLNSPEIVVVEYQQF